MSRSINDIPRTTKVVNGWTVETLNPGRLVFCDDCGADFTDKTDSGGILFGSKAICPDCAPTWVANAKEYSEEHFIKARCPENKSFADWVREDLR